MLFSCGTEWNGVSFSFSLSLLSSLFSQDTVQVRFPGFNGPGHYIVHYTWRGYTNTIDVDLFEDEVEHVYGLELTTPEFDRIDHCQFNTGEQILSPLFNATVSPTEAVRYMFSHFPVLGNGQTVLRNSIGINVVPLKLPDDVFQPTPAMLPFHKARRADRLAYDPLQHNCWVKLPTGCNRKFDYTSTPTQWFFDPQGQNGGSACTTTRRNRWNSFCTRTDCQAQWGLRPEPDPAISMLKMTPLELGTPQRSDDFLQQLQVKRTENTRCVNSVDMGQHLAREGVQCSETTTPCGVEDYRRIIQIYAIIYAQEDSGQVPRFRLRGKTNDDNTPMISVRTDGDGKNQISYCTTVQTSVQADSWVLEWEFGTSTDTDRFNSPAVDGPEIKISFQFPDVAVPDGWYGDFGHTFGQKNGYMGWTMKAVHEENCQHLMTGDECRELGASKTFANVLDGTSLGENVGYGITYTEAMGYRGGARGCHFSATGNFYQIGYTYKPYLPGIRTVETSAQACHDQCKLNEDCAYFNFWPSNGGCHLSSSAGVLSANSNIISGAKNATAGRASVYVTSVGDTCWCIYLCCAPYRSVKKDLDHFGFELFLFY